MGQIKLWTKAEAEYLVKYYSPILIGKPIANKPHKIVRLDFEDYDKGTRVVCIGLGGSYLIKQDLSSYAEEKDIIMPDEVLKGKKE